MKKQNMSRNTMEQLEDLLEKGILTEEEYEAKKQQIASTESEISQEPNKQSLVEKARQLYAIVSPKFAPVKAFAMKRKKLTCIIMALILLVVGFLPGYSIGRKHPSNVHVTLGSPDESIEVKGKGSSKNPYHLNEDITFETFSTECGQYVTYTVNISRVLRASALNRYMDAGENEIFNSAGLIASIRAEWEGTKTATVSMTPYIGIVYRNSTKNSAALHNMIYGKDGAWNDKLFNGVTYNDVILRQVRNEKEEMDHIQIKYSTKDSSGEMVEYSIYVAFDPKVVES